MSVIGMTLFRLLVGALGYPISVFRSVSIIGKALAPPFIGALGYPIPRFGLWQ